MEETGFFLSDFVLSAGQSKLLFAVSFLFAGFWVDRFAVAWVSSDSVMGFFVHGFQRFTVDAVFDVLAELFSVSFFVITFQFFHVFSDVSTEDVFAVGFGVEVVFFVVVAWESFGGVWDIETTVDGSFQSTKNFVSGGGSGETGIEEASEWTWTIITWFNVVFITINFGLSYVSLVELHFGEKSSSKEKTGAVVGGVVGETDFDTEFWEFVSVSSADDNITAHSWISNLADNISVGGSNNQSVFWGVEFVLVLGAETSSGLVIGFTDLSPLEFWLEPFEVSLVLLDFDQSVSSLFSSVSVFTGHFLGLPQFFYL